MFKSEMLSFNWETLILFPVQRFVSSIKGMDGLKRTGYVLNPPPQKKNNKINTGNGGGGIEKNIFSI